MTVDAYAVTRGCGTKKRYDTEDHARMVAAKCLDERRVFLRPYLCGVCGGFHLTSQKPDVAVKPGWRPARDPVDVYRKRRRDQYRRDRGRK